MLHFNKLGAAEHVRFQQNAFDNFFSRQVTYFQHYPKMKFKKKVEKRPTLTHMYSKSWSFISQWKFLLDEYYNYNTRHLAVHAFGHKWTFCHKEFSLYRFFNVAFLPQILFIAGYSLQKFLPHSIWLAVLKFHLQIARQKIKPPIMSIIKILCKVLAS